MKPHVSDAARHGPRLWWLMLAGVAARATADRPTARLMDGFVFGLGLLCLCALLRFFLYRGPQARVRAQRVGWVVAGLGLLPAAMRVHGNDWLSALVVLLLAIQAGAYIAAAKRVHVWWVLVTGCAVLMITAAGTRAPLFLPCAAWFTFMALGVLAAEHREQRATSAAFVASDATERHSGGWLFTGVTLLLTIPVYLFVPKPGSERSSVETDARAFRDTPVAEEPAVPWAPASLSTPLPLVLPDLAPSAGSALAIDSVRHVARPESGDYGEDFGIDDVVRRKAFANHIVLYARSSQSVNLRGRIYDRFVNDRWSRSLAESQRLRLDGRSLVLLSRPAGPTPIAQTIEVAQDLDAALVHAPGVERLRFPAKSLQRYDDGVLVADEPLREGTSYSVDARLTLREGRYVLLEPPPRSLAPYLQADAASPRLRELAAEVSASATSKLGKALALEQHLRTHYAYTYETLAQQNNTPLDWFLFEGRRGHCEFFASALAMMLRSVGIPSRVATGFSLGDPNPITGFHEVRALDGHAWVEAYLGEGWLMLEPTPFYPLPQPDIDRQVAEQMDGYLERLATTRTLLAPATLETQLTVLARDLWQGTRSGLRIVTQTLQTRGWLLPLVVIGIIAAMLALYLVGVAALDWIDNLRIRRVLDTLPAHDARAATLLVGTALLRTTAPRSFARRPDWTLREYAEQLVMAASNRQRPAIQIPLQFIEAFDAARYDSQANAASSLTAAIDLIREQLRSHPWPRLHTSLTRLRWAWRRRPTDSSNVLETRALTQPRKWPRLRREPTPLSDHVTRADG